MLLSEYDQLSVIIVTYHIGKGRTSNIREIKMIINKIVSVPF